MGATRRAGAALASMLQVPQCLRSDPARHAFTQPTGLPAVYEHSWTGPRVRDARARARRSLAQFAETVRRPEGHRVDRDRNGIVSSGFPDRFIGDGSLWRHCGSLAQSPERTAGQLLREFIPIDGPPVGAGRGRSPSPTGGQEAVLPDP